MAGREPIFEPTKGAVLWRRVHAIEKSIRLLDCFWLARRPLSLSELEKRTGWAKSTIHGLLASMLDSGVVEQNAGDGKYRLGYHLFELGSAVNQSWDVPNLCRPHLQHLVDCFNESVYLARLSGDDLLLAVCEEPHKSFRITSEVGTRLPLHCSSQGKVILANRSRYEAERLLHRAPLELMTPHTTTEPELLLDSLAAIRAQGYAEEHEEYKLGLQSVAAPIFSRDGACSYAIGVICMTTVPREAFDAVRVAVVQTANAISSALQNRTPLEAADKPHMDALAAHGTMGLVRTVPQGMPPGSETANMSVMGFPPARLLQRALSAGGRLAGH